MAHTDLATILASMLEDIPRVRVGTHLHHTNFLVGNKVFAFIQRDGVALKLPKATVQELLDAQRASRLVMGKRVMKAWIVIKHDHPEAYQQDEALFRAAIAFVAAET